MVCFKAFTCLMAALVPLISASVLEPRRAVHCTGVAKNPPPAGYICGLMGTATDRLLTVGAYNAPNQTACLNACLNDYPNCVSFEYGPGQHCELYAKKITKSAFKKGNTGRKFWNRHCYTSTCDCPSKLSPCYGECVNLLTDNQSCGKCSTVCGQNQSCTKGKCICSPGYECSGQCISPGDQITCNGKCYDGQFGNQNCGSCGNTCMSPFTCFFGNCHCPDGYDECTPGQCADLSNDPNNCFYCGISCNGGTCSNGQCTCINNDTMCDNGNCADLTSDPNNCGSCGNVCDASASCTNSACTCPSGSEFCSGPNGPCTDTSSDPDNCGGCGQSCQGGTCTQGVCTS